MLASFLPIPFGHIPIFPPGMAKGQRCCCRAGYRGQEEAQTGAGCRGDPSHADPLLTGGGTEQGGASVGLCLPSVSAPLAPSRLTPVAVGLWGPGLCDRGWRRASQAGLVPRSPSKSCQPPYTPPPKKKTHL